MLYEQAFVRREETSVAALPMLSSPEEGAAETRTVLRLVVDGPASQLRRGPSLQVRRAARARMLRRRRRTVVAVVLTGALVVLALPGHAFGGVTGAGLPGDLASSSVLASGMRYVVQPGDTVSSIAQLMNPVSPQTARAILEHQLGSGVVVVGEHVVIP